MYDDPKVFTLTKTKSKQEYIPVGCVPSAAVAVSGGQPEWGVCRAGGCLPRGFCRGVYTPWTQMETTPWTQRQIPPGPRGRYPSGPRGRHPPPGTESQTRCKNITFPQLLLRTVAIERPCSDEQLWAWQAHDTGHHYLPSHRGLNPVSLASPCCWVHLRMAGPLMTYPGSQS